MLTTKVTVAFEAGHRYFAATVDLHVAWQMILCLDNGKAQCPDVGMGGSYDTVKVELRRQLGQAVSSQSLWLVFKVLAGCCLPQLLGHQQQMKNKIRIKSSQVFNIS